MYYEPMSAYSIRQYNSHSAHGNSVNYCECGYCEAVWDLWGLINRPTEGGWFLKNALRRAVNAHNEITGGEAWTRKTC